MTYNSKTLSKGRFTPKNPEKYMGDVTNIIYRSSWELKLLNFLDKHPSIIRYNSEETIIPYVSPVDNRIHRYFPDFLVKKKGKDGKISTAIIEVKPASQTIPPMKQKTINKRYINEVMTYGVNQAKWNSAKKYCEDRGWEFLIFTEKELNISW